MSAHDDVRAEEQAAAKRERDLARARRAAAAARVREWRALLRVTVRETRAKYPRCRCNFTGVRSRDDLRAMGGGCTMPSYACPRLAAVRKKLSGSS